jgi:mannose-6-phosphate isomerase-like protein (cupin superfamily)
VLFMPQSIKAAVLYRGANAPVTYREHFTPRSGNLEFLSCGEFEIQPGAATQPLAFPHEEALLYAWRGTAAAEVEGASYEMAEYDVLYLPKGQTWSLSNNGKEPARLWLTRAPAQNVHPVFHAQFARISKDESRIRRLSKRNVYMMFDVSELADKLVAGYSFFEPYSRSWPPHNHTDQEEVYIFLSGRGSMEVYESPEQLTFVREVSPGDLVTIPYFNYHPVFAQEEPVVFIWCIAGERYWVGDKNKEFMKGTGGPITT